MSGLIKAAAAGVVRSFDLGAFDEPAGRPVDPPMKSETEIALDRAREEITELQLKLLAADEVRRDERDEAYEAGLKEGAERAADDAERRLARLGEMGEEALGAWRGRIAELDELAVALARGAVSKVFSPHADLADLIGRAIEAKVSQLQNQAVVAIRVSTADFESSAALAAVTAGVEIVIDRLL